MGLYWRKSEWWSIHLEKSECHQFISWSKDKRHWLMYNSANRMIFDSKFLFCQFDLTNACFDMCQCPLPWASPCRWGFVLHCIVYYAKPPPGSLRHRITHMQNLVYFNRIIELFNCLNFYKVVSVTVSGKLFHNFITNGKKESRWQSTLDRGLV